MELVFLGTSAMVPTKERNHSGVFLSHDTEGILFDCGENTQRQLKIAGIRPAKLTRILISHLHGDHVFGLPGLIQTLGGSNYEGTLKLYGPKGFSMFIKNLFKTFAIEDRIDIEVKEATKGVFVDTEEFVIEASPLDHGIPCLGYAFHEKDRRRINVSFVKKLGIPDGPLLGELQKNNPITFKGKAVLPADATYTVKGRKVAYVVDTRPCKGALVIAKDADVFICEATYESSLHAKGEEYFHMTAEQAATLASQAGVKKLILTHFSQRYKDMTDVVDDAKKIFPDVVCAFDFMKVKV